MEKNEVKGRIMIRKGNDNQEPMVVYVLGKNAFGSYACKALNTGDILLSDTYDLIEFNYDEFTKMSYQWEIANCDRTKERFIQLYSEYINKKQDYPSNP